MVRRFIDAASEYFVMFLALTLLSASACAGVDTNSAAYKDGQLTGQIIVGVIALLVIRKLFFSKK